MARIKLLTISNVADELNVSHKTVRRLLAEGMLEWTRIRYAVRIFPESLDAYIRNQTAAVRFENGIPEFSGTWMDRDGQRALKKKLPRM